MITPQEALGIVLDHARRLEPVEMSLLESVGAILAETVASDTDLPPFDKSAMDGYACRASDLERLPTELLCIEELPAGRTPILGVRAGTCARIMTGAPVPEGADLIVPVEDTEPAAGGRIRILRAAPGRPHICRRGEDIRAGDPVLAAGCRIGPAQAALLASVGRERVSVFRRPRLAVLATGDELVPASAVPGPGQIRDANSWGLMACCVRAGVPGDPLGVARDNRSDLRSRLVEGLSRDVLLVSGGVSAGQWDLVPEVLADLGVTLHFRSVAMKPGRPTVFGTHGPTLVFGLPGNPVSTLVGFRLFVWPAVRRMMGFAEPFPPALEAMLRRPLKVTGDRTTFVPAVLTRAHGAWAADPIESHGSADLVAFSRANALVMLDPGTYGAGTVATTFPLDIS